MRSEASPAGRWAWLRSQGLGVCCGLATSLLLALGSVVLAVTSAGASAAVRLDDFRAFFAEPSPAHFWFYLLLPVVALYALNTLLATWHNVALRWRVGTRDPRAYAAAVVHVAFLVALWAHLVGGFYGADEARTIGGSFAPLSPGVEARMVDLSTERLPGGMPKQVLAALELRAADGTVTPAELGFNRPLSTGWGARLVLLQQPFTRALAVLAAGEENCVLAPGERCSLAGRAVAVVEVQATDAHGPLLRVSVDGRESWLMRGMALDLGPGGRLVLSRVERENALAVRVRHAPGNPWALAAALLLALGVALMTRRFVQTG
jgi:hypothetical protein